MIVLAQTVGQLQETWSAILRFVPRALAFVVILVVGYLIARALARAVDSVLKRIGFDRAVRRSGINSALERSGYDAADLLAKIVFYGLVLLVLQLAFGVFGPNPVSDLLNSVIAFLPRLFVAVIIVVVAAAIAAAVRDVIASLIGPLSYGRLLAFSAYGLILGLGVFAALDQLDVAPTIVSGLFYALLAIIAGVIIVAVGGGGIAPMRQRWEHALTRMDQEAERIRETAREERERREAAELAERERRAELERQAEAERQAEVERLAEVERMRQEAIAEEERLAQERQAAQVRTTQQVTPPTEAEVDETQPVAVDPDKTETISRDDVTPGSTDPTDPVDPDATRPVRRPRGRRPDA